MNADNTQKPLILVTGSSGLIGAKLIQELSNAYRVVGLDVEPPNEKEADAQDQSESSWIHCDLTKNESVISALNQIRTDFGDTIASVIHLAAYYDFSGESSPLYQELTVEGTRRLLRELQPFQVEQFVFSSTLLVMQSAEEDLPLTADSPLEAEWDYPQSKLAAEKVIQQERNKIPAVILRIAGVYDEDCRSLPIAQQIYRIYTKQWESYFFPGDKTAGQAFIHLEDLVDCFQGAVAARRKLPPHEVFLIGEEDVMSYEELQEELGQRIHGEHWPALRIPKPVAKAGAWVKEKLSDKEKSPFIKPWMVDLADQNYPVNIQRAREQLGWAPQHTLRSTLPQMIERLRQNPQHWFEANDLPTPE